MNQKLESEIGQRKRLTWTEYEQLHENKLAPEESMVYSKKEFVLVNIDTKKESRGERRYIYNE